MVSNINQLLLRNIELLEGKQPLLINLDANELIQPWFDYYPDVEQITCFNNQLNTHQRISKQDKVSTFFDSHYQSDSIHDLVIIAFPKSKAELAFTLAMIAPVTDENSYILVVGDNKSGIKTLAKSAPDYIEFCTKQDAARHCLLYSIRLKTVSTAFQLEQWFSHYQVDVNNQQLTIAALPGVFSQQGLDKGTKVLLENLPEQISGSVLDFGCGAGIISVALAKQFDNLDLTLVDVSALAIASSKESLKLNNLTGNVIASDGLQNISQRYDTIVSNPPFHQGLKTHYAATEVFLAQAKNHLNNQGQLLVVANSFLKYQPIMEQAIKQTHRIVNEKGFAVYLAKK